MFATITVNGKPVNLKASLYSNMIYKSAFGKNMLTDMVKAETAANLCNSAKSDIERIDAAQDVKDIGYQVIWALAKEADDSIPAFPAWIRGIEDIDFSAAYGIAAKLIVDAQKLDRKNV